MAPKVIAVKHVGEHRLELRFEVGVTSTVDFKARVLGRGGVWEPLHQVEYFRQVRVDPELATIVWPNGVDVCPDVLYGLATGKPLAGTEVGEAVGR